MSASASRGIRFGNYVLLRRLARGGMAEVFLAQQQGLEGFDRRVALKRILPHLADAPDFVKMFLSEARLAAQLSHPNIVHIYEFGKVEHDYFIAMEYVEGVHAGQLFKHGKEHARLTPTLIARIGADAAAALHYAHELRNASGQPYGLVHRDVSPANLMVSFDGVVKLCDFGIAKAVSATEHLTNPGQVKGKYAYMSPEQTVAQQLDGRSDVFSLAIVLWELLVGQTIIPRGDAVEAMRAIRDGKLTPIAQAAPRTPPALAKAITWAMATRREERATAMQLAQALEAFIKSSPELATPMQLGAWVRQRFTRESTAQLEALPDAEPAPGSIDTPRTAVLEGTRAGEPTPPSAADAASSVEASQPPAPPYTVTGAQALAPPRRPTLPPPMRAPSASTSPPPLATSAHRPTTPPPIEGRPPTVPPPIAGPVRRPSTPPPLATTMHRPSTPPPIEGARAPTSPPPVAGPTRRPSTPPPLATTTHRPSTPPPVEDARAPTTPPPIAATPAPGTEVLTSTVVDRRALAPRLALALGGLAVAAIAIVIGARSCGTKPTPAPMIAIAPLDAVREPDAAPPPDATTIDAPPAPTLLEVRTKPTGGTIRLGGEVRVAPAKFALAPGSYALVAELDGYQPEQRTVELIANVDLVHEIAFVRKASTPPRPTAPVMGSLTVRTTPYSVVYDGTRRLGETPFADLALPAGTYVLTFKNPQHPVVRRRVVITAGKTTKLAFELAARP